MISTREVLKRLDERFSPSNGYAFITEVNLYKGYRSRRADGMAIGLWESTGLMTAIGFEVKTNRADWLGELNDPSKAEPLIKQCKEFYLAVGDKKIVEKDELPKGWGLMIPSGKKMRIAKRSAFNREAQIDMYPIAKMVERALVYSPSKKALKSEYDRGYDEGMTRGKNTRYGKSLVDQRDEAIQKLKEFKELTGIELDGWHSAEDLAHRMNVGSHVVGNWKSFEQVLCNLETVAVQSRARLKNVRAELEALKKPPERQQSLDV